MKITVCFGDTNVIVPCGDGNTSVNDFTENAILRYKKATLKVSSRGKYFSSNHVYFCGICSKSTECLVKVLKLKTKRDGGILDPDDVLKDVVEDKELVS